MALQAAAFLGAGLLVTVLHTVAPDHWLPFIVVGRARRWPLARTLRLTLLSSAAHVGLTILLGLAIALVSLESLNRIEGLQGLMAGVALVALGLIFVGLQARRRTCDCGLRGLDGAASATLAPLVALAPCYPILPLFLSVQALGWGVTLALALLFAGVTVAMMLALVLGASRGLLRATETGGWARLERHEGYVMGGILIAVGLVAAWA